MGWAWRDSKMAWISVHTAFVEELSSVLAALSGGSQHPLTPVDDRVPNTFFWFLPALALKHTYCRPCSRHTFFFFNLKAKWGGKGIILKVYLLFADKLRGSFGLPGIFMLTYPELGPVVKFLNPLDN